MSQTVTNLPGGMDFITRVDLTKGQSSGVLVSVIVSLFSMFSAVGLLCALAVSAWNTRRSVNPNLFTRSHVCAYFVSLLLCDITQAVGSLMNVRWYANMAVVYEPYCTSQGLIKQMADVSTAMWTFIIALHTFFVVCLRWNPHRWSLFATLVCGWFAVFFVLVLGPAAMYKSELGAFYGISGYWCWISNNYPSERITLDYMWLFISAILTFTMYALVFFTLRGNIVIKGRQIRVHIHRDSSGAGVDSETISIAKQMLLYPIAYTILILPIAFCRFVEWNGHVVPDAATFFSDSVFLLSGVVNMTLFVLTRRVLPEHSVLPRSVSVRMPRVGSIKRGPQTTQVVLDNASDIDSMKTDLEKGDCRNSMVQVDLTPRIAQRPESPNSARAEHEVEIRVESVLVDRIPRIPVPAEPSPLSEPPSPPGLSDELSRRLSLVHSEDGLELEGEPEHELAHDDDHDSYYDPPADDVHHDHLRDSYYSTTSSSGSSSPRSAPLLPNPYSPRRSLAQPMSAMPLGRPQAGDHRV